MDNIKKQKNYRKKKIDEDNQIEVKAAETNTDDVSAAIEEFHEIRKLRRKQAGIDAEKLSKGLEKKIKKKKQQEGWNISVEPKSKLDDDEFSTSKKLKLDSFTTQTNTLDVDKHMMEYIETEMKKRRGYTPEDDEEEDDEKNKGFHDIYEELYRIPDRLKGEQKVTESEGNVQLSSQMLTAIPEVDLGIDTRLQNIEETEKAKRRLIDETQKLEQEKKDEEPFVPANFEKQIHHEFRPRLNQKLMATDEQAVARFKKRMRK
ncbi:hypothetical protein G6F70_008164 [Rhizopus microsporus]|uniref:Uncharacterized protein n=2 Tax=Rhizopus TaxID=4842 RepID=A0A367IW85_RHIAZ|nr:hypothetical protein G6F71_008167 [Rhizopus microsporus]RCH81731.1 hypothetical protein CU097_004860 [Rhizopus azygosporus]KAG1195529.1 hypothetical protein G6F70_008164 [Rhizopus microsporus]KAG1207371.1 hypothetical protein G6F69_008102 [Rhizopus microsporus]KAG1231569.1 hypothetical protein G6F67_005654 [Rhizopus microsporus]